MTDKEIIKREIERRIKVLSEDKVTLEVSGMLSELRYFRRFINSMDEEFVREDLESEVKKLWQEINTGHQYSILDSYNQFYGMCLDIAEWQKQKLINDAVDGTLLGGHLIRQEGITHPLHSGDKVKLIVIKEDKI